MTTLTRAELTKAVGSDPKIVRAFEEQQNNVADTVAKTAQNVAATAALQDATVVTLSPNDTLNNERILATGDGLTLIDQGPGQDIVIATDNVPLTQGGYDLTFNLFADSSLDLPTTGRVLTDQDFNAGPYANDAAAAAGGVRVGDPYKRSDGVYAWRQS